MTTDMFQLCVQKLSSLHTYSTAHLAGTNILCTMDSKSCLTHIDNNLVKQKSQRCSRSSDAGEMCSNESM